MLLSVSTNLASEESNRFMLSIYAIFQDFGVYIAITFELMVNQPNDSASVESGIDRSDNVTHVNSIRCHFVSFNVIFILVGHVFRWIRVA